MRLPSDNVKSSASKVEEEVSEFVVDGEEFEPSSKLCNFSHEELQQKVIEDKDELDEINAGIESPYFYFSDEDDRK